jgi:hypothetical protein
MTVCRLWAHNKLFVVIIIPNWIHNLYRNHEKFLKKESFPYQAAGRELHLKKDGESAKDGLKDLPSSLSGYVTSAGPYFLTFPYFCPQFL